MLDTDIQKAAEELARRKKRNEEAHENFAFALRLVGMVIGTIAVFALLAVIPNDAAGYLFIGAGGLVVGFIVAAYWLTRPGPDGY